MNLLLVEDDAILGKSLHRGLTEAGYPCQWSRAGQEALSQMAGGKFDVVILDLMLPDISGLDVLRKMRDTEDSTPVLVLTALGSVDSRVAGLNAGADDYLVKPFAFAELVARLLAICRRANSQTATVVIDGPVKLDLRTHRAVREGQEIDLTPTEFKLLDFLMQSANQVVTRRMLCEYLWEADWEGVTNVIEVHINRLRAKIDRGFSKPVIETVRGLGYVYRSE